MVGLAKNGESGGGDFQFARSLQSQKKEKTQGDRSNHSKGKRNTGKRMWTKASGVVKNESPRKGILAPNSDKKKGGSNDNA